MFFSVGLILFREGLSQTTDTTTAKILWKNKLTLGINLTQISYSNWAKGGQNSIAWNIRLDGEASRNGLEWEWLFTSIIIFGQSKQYKDVIDKLQIKEILGVGFSYNIL